MNITYTNKITVEQFNALRAAVGWGEMQIDLAQKGLDHTAFIVVANNHDGPIGMARVVTDYGYTVLIADVAVLPDYQHQGIGRTMMKMVMEFVDDSVGVGQGKFICLMAAKGREAFYENFGFEARPNEKSGCGMTQWIEKEVEGT